MKKFIGFIFFGSLSKKYCWEIQLFAPLRSLSDGISFLEFKINLDRYESYHSPAFQMELTFFNIYNHIWIYKSKNKID